MRLDRFLRPKSVAVIGGTEAERVVEQLDLLEFSGEIWPVHPSRTAIAGRSCVTSVDDLVDSPDAAFVAVPNRVTAPIVRSLAALGTGGIVVYTSGFAESGLAELQDELIAAAGDTPLLGPNTYGFINALDGAAVWPDVHGLRRVDQGVAIITQSGNIGINLTMARRGLEIGMIVTAGNQAVIDIPALMDAFLDDTRVSAIGVQLESLGDAQDFARCAVRARDQRIPLVALRMGASSLGAIVTASHTGALAGDNDFYDALFRRYGVATVGSIPSFLEALKLAGSVKAQPRVITLSASGGEAAHVADLADSHGLELPALEPGHVIAIEETVHELVTVSNPMDYHTISWGDEPGITRTFQATVDGPFDLGMLVLDFPLGEIPEPWWGACRAFAKAVSSIPGLVVSTLPETMPPRAQEEIRAMGLIPMMGLVETIEAIAALGVAAEAVKIDRHLPGRSIVGLPVTLDEAESKKMLANLGVPVPIGHVTSDPASTTVPYPITVKVLGIEHKAEVSAVAVGVPDPDALAQILPAMPGEQVYLVEETVGEGLGELLASVRSIDHLGWMLTIATGGSRVEEIDDRAHLLVPSTPDQIRAAIDRLRNKLKGDVNAVIDAVLTLQSLPTTEEDLIEAEINPLIVLEDGVMAADAMVTVG